MNISFFSHSGKIINNLCFRHGRQSSYCQRLCLSAGKQCGSVYAGKQSYFAGNRTDFVQSTAIRTDFVHRNHVTDNFLCQMVKAICYRSCMIGIYFLEVIFCFFFHFRHNGFTGKFIGIKNRFFQRLFRISSDRCLNFFGNFRKYQCPFLLSHFSNNFILKSH